MKILLVSQSILPYPGGSSVIVENLASNFGKEDLVVVGSAPYFRQKIKKRAADVPDFLYLPTEFSFFGRGRRYFRWLDKWQFRPLVEKMKNIAREQEIDYILAVYPDAKFCHAACRAAQELKLPFSSYFHNTYIENTNIKNPRASKIQAEIFEHSEHIFVMSKGMQRFYEEKYRLDKFVPLVHTFNEYPTINQPKTSQNTHKLTYQLVAIGNFNESNLDATRRLVNAIKNNPKYELNLYTHVPKLLLQQRGIDTSAIHHRGFVRPEEVHDVLQQYDICVLTHGFKGGYGEVEYKTIFPTRTIPFLLSGKPIFAHSPKASFLNDFIEENDCAALVDKANESAIIAGLNRITEDLVYQRQLVQNAQQTAQKFYGKAVVKQLKNRLAR
ncbi:MAG: glycosyltransferase [Bacteroidota bacterium]